ncbi:MAG: hypothetical protein OEZ02_01460 [Anaerolineae bacterium]|nr:hypothetical protein [Anaerolineae bacterium]
MSILGLELCTPILNAAGTLGFSLDRQAPIDSAQLGGFITNPVSLAPRKPANSRTALEYPGGLLLHTGHPNPGLKTVIRDHSAKWRRASYPVIVHVLAGDQRDLAKMVAQLEELEGAAGIELGLPDDIGVSEAAALTGVAVGELPVIVRVPLEGARELAGAVFEAGANAVSLGPGRGALPDQQGHRVHGRLYGPGIFPQALAAVAGIAGQDIPVIGAGGIYGSAQIEAMLEAGALAVQLDAVLWRGNGIENGDLGLFAA